MEINFRDFDDWFITEILGLKVYAVTLDTFDNKYEVNYGAFYYNDEVGEYVFQIYCDSIEENLVKKLFTDKQEAEAYCEYLNGE